MTIGQRIRKARLNREITQQELGELVGFPDDSADVRIAQYESSTRRPKPEVRAKICEVLRISPRYLNLPENYDIDDIVLMMFEIGEEMNYAPADYVEMCKMLTKWTHISTLFAEGKITKFEFYNQILTTLL